MNLLPCPFCGSEPILEEDQAFPSCSNSDCEALGPACITDPEGAWNRRTSPWRPIETAPKDGTRVDLWAGVRICDALWRCPSEVHADDPLTYSWWAPSPECYSAYPEMEDTPIGVIPTHWMPVPEPPEVE